VSTRRRGRPATGEPTPVTDIEILDMALEAFAELGYEGASIRDLGRRLDVSHNLIPQRFGTKEKLWYAAVDQGFGRLSVDLWTVLQDPPGDEIGRLRIMVQRFIEASAGHPALLRVINQEATTPGPRLDYLFRQFIEPIRLFGDSVLAPLSERGLARATPASLFYFLLVHGAGGPFALSPLAQHFGETVDPSDPVAVREHAERVVEILFDGLLRT
jgi:AcrR family transcriptional regulator